MDLLTIAIPIYNETSPVLNLVKKVVTLKQNTEIIVIDDGSTLEESKRIFKQIEILYPQIILIKNEKNSGKAFSVRRALSIATGKYFVVLDGDGELDPNGINKLLNEIVARKAHIVNGKRELKVEPGIPNKVNLISKIAKFITTFAIRIFYGHTIVDVLSGYKMFDTKIFKKMDIKSNRFGLEVELVTLSIVNKLKISEVAVKYNPRSYKEGKKINILDSIEMLRMLISRSERWKKLYKTLIPILIFSISFFSFTHSLNYFHTTDSLPVSLTAVNMLYNNRLDMTNYKDILIDRDLLGITVPGSKNQIYSKAPVILSYFSVPIFWSVNYYFGINNFDFTWIFDNNYLQYLGKINAVFYVSFSGVFLYYILNFMTTNTKISLSMTFIYLFVTNIANTAAQANWQHGVSLCFINLFILIFIKAKYFWHYLVLGMLLAVLGSIRITNLFYIFTVPIYTLYYWKSWKLYLSQNLLYLLSFTLCFLSISYYFNSIGVPYGYSSEIILSFSEITPRLFISNLGALLFSYNYGLFYFTPVLLLIFTSPIRSSKLAIALLPTLLIFPIFAAIWWMWTGGMALNARLLSEVMPILTIYLLISYVQYKPLTTYRILFTVLVTIGLFNNFLTTYMMDYSWHDKYLEHGGHKSQVHNAWVSNPTLLAYLSDRRYITTNKLLKNDGVISERIRVYRPSIQYLGFPKIFDTTKLIYTP